MKKLFLLAILSMIVFLPGCGGTKSAMPLDMITAHKWQLQSVRGQWVDATQYGNGLPFANFTTENKVMGNGGCNSFSGSFNINNEGGINVSRLVSTKMACNKGNDKETEFLTTLEKANQVKIDKDKLTLLEGVEEILVFRPMPAE